MGPSQKINISVLDQYEWKFAMILELE